MVDEPVLRTLEEDREPDAHRDAPVEARIRRLLATQRYAVLATQGDTQPYASLVAFAATDDLRVAVFATPMATRKYRLLSSCDRVALLVDDRPEHPQELMTVEAVTATGHARQVEAGPELERWAALLIGRHPHLAAFVRAPTCALFHVAIVRFFHVSRFQEVRQWVPPARQR